MSYYKDHSDEFINSTFNCDMSAQYSFFEKFLKKSGVILDIGFGSGRDSLYFLKKGYDVYAIDPEESFVGHGKELGISHAYRQKVEEMNFVNMFDGIWACASLLHVKSNCLNDVFCRCCNALKKDGVMYASFKYGNFEGTRNGRFYLDLNEESIKTFLIGSGLCLIDYSITFDVRANRDDKWLNVILKKE